MEKRGAVFIAMGFEAVGLVTVCVLIGRWLDDRYGWTGLGAAAGAIIGVVGWMTHLIVALRQLSNDSENSEGENGK